jgi:hypothetical protein
MTVSMLLFFTGCLPETTTTINATVFNTNDEKIANANIVVRDSTGLLYTSSESNELGEFSVTIPSHTNFFVVISADEYQTSSFSGYAGEGEFDVPAGTLWLRTDEEISSLQEEFTTCQAESSLIDGEVRLAINGQSDVESLPLVTSATVVAVDQLEQEYNGCYLPTLDEETGEYIPSSTTGEYGRFAINGLNEGVHLLEISVQYDDENSEVFPYFVFVPENGNVPLYPAFITMIEN